MNPQIVATLAGRPSGNISQCLSQNTRKLLRCINNIQRGRNEKSCLVFSPLRLRSFRAKLRCLRLACRSYEPPNRASGHMVVMALLESVCAATERPWHALCADPISGLGSENSKSVEGSKSTHAQCTFFSCIQTPNRAFSVQTTISHRPFFFLPSHTPWTH